MTKSELIQSLTAIVPENNIIYPRRNQRCR